MEDITVVKGVFVYTKKIDSEFIVKCLQAMLNIFPAMKFTSIIADEKFIGYRVHFSNLDEEELIAQRYLTVSGQKIPICAIETNLTIHNTTSRGELLESDIRNALSDKFGKLLNIAEVPRSACHKNENIKIFRALIDIPEIKVLEVFRPQGIRAIYMWLPDKKINLKVNLYCKICDTDGHITQNCSERNVANERVDSRKEERMHADSTMKVDFNFEPKEAFTEKIGREVVMKTEFFSEGKENVKETILNKSIAETKESEENIVTFTAPMNIKKEMKEDVMFHDNDDSNSNLNYDEDIQMIDCSSSPNSANACHKVPFKPEYKDGAATSDEDSKSNISGNSVEKPSFFAVTFTRPGPSSEREKISSRPSTAVESTIVLSRTLQNCIDKACEEFDIIDRKTLDAFLIHVKKKSNPNQVAENYTRNAEKLKELLQYILKMYYTTPQTGSKEDIRFIKWLDQLVKRFEPKIPKKRKRAEQNDDDTPTEK